MGERPFDEQDVERLAAVAADAVGSKVFLADLGVESEFREEYRVQVRALLSTLDKEGRLRAAGEIVTERRTEFATSVKYPPGRPCGTDPLTLLGDGSLSLAQIRADIHQESGAEVSIIVREQITAHTGWRPAEPGVPSGQESADPAPKAEEATSHRVPVPRHRTPLFVEWSPDLFEVHAGQIEGCEVCADPAVPDQELGYPTKRPGWLGEFQPWPCGRCGEVVDDSKRHPCTPASRTPGEETPTDG